MFGAFSGLRRLATFVGALGLVLGLSPAVAGPVAAAAVPAPAAAQVVQVTFIKVLCPAYTVVPANKNPTNLDATGGHGGQLDTSYQTTLVDPTTDIPASCHRADGWQFQMYNSAGLSTSVGSPITTGADGTGSGAVTITLDSTELALAQSGGAPTGLWVVEIEQPGVAGFGALRCYRDILNGDNLENIRNVGSASLHAYCIAYNVTPNLATPSPTASPKPTATPTAVQTVEGATATPTAFQSFEGATATPASTSTPPPTSTDGPSNGGTTPLIALLICSALGGLAFAAAQSQRRSIGR